MTDGRTATATWSYMSPFLSLLLVLFHADQRIRFSPLVECRTLKWEMSRCLSILLKYLFGEGGIEREKARAK